MSSEIINKVDQAGLITLDVNSLAPIEKRDSIDLVNWLDDNMIIREASFRQKLSVFKWERLKGSCVAVFHGVTFGETFLFRFHIPIGVKRLFCLKRTEF